MTNVTAVGSEKTVRDVASRTAASGAANAAAKASSAAEFAATLGQASPAAAVNGDPATRVLPFDMVSRGSRSGVLTPSQQFESFVLQSFIEPMLPKDDSSFFGEGTAGAIWRSMLAERIGGEMAAAGGVGIAEIVEKRNASVKALAEAKDTLAHNAAQAQGAALSKPGAL